MLVAVADGVYPLVEHVDGRLLTVTLIVGTRGVVLVDTGVASTPERVVVPALASLGLAPADVRQIVITHSDVDHSGGLGAMLALAPQATAIAHELDVAWIEDVELLIERRYLGLRDAHGFDQDPSFLAWVRASDTRGIVHLAAHGGEGIRLEDDRTLEIVHVPGHSRGHVAVVDPITRTGVIGDAVFGGVTPMADGRGSTAPGYYEVASYRATIERLARHRLERLVGTHYPLLEGGQVQAFLAESAAFTDRLEAAVVDQLDASREPLDARTMVARVAPSLRAWPAEADSSLNVAVVAHLDDLTSRGIAERAEARPAAWTWAGR